MKERARVRRTHETLTNPNDRGSTRARVRDNCKTRHTRSFTGKARAMRDREIARRNLALRLPSSPTFPTRPRAACAKFSTGKPRTSVTAFRNCTHTYVRAHACTCVRARAYNAEIYVNLRVAATSRRVRESESESALRIIT